MAQKRKSTKNNKRTSTNGKNTRNNSKLTELDTDMVLNEAVVIIGFLAALIMLLGNLGLCGPVGSWLKSLQTGLFGMLGYVFPIWMFVSIVLIMSNAGNRRAVLIVVASFFALIALGALLHLFAGKNFEEIDSLMDLYTAGEGGGLLGGVLAGGLENVIGFAGSLLVNAAILIVALVVVTGKSFVNAVSRGSGEVYEHAKTGAAHLHEEHLIKSEERKRRREMAQLANIDLKAQSRTDQAMDIQSHDDQLHSGNYTDDESQPMSSGEAEAAEGTGFAAKEPESAAYIQGTFTSSADADLKTLSDDALAKETHSLAAAVSSIAMRQNGNFSTPQAVQDESFEDQYSFDHIQTYDYTSEEAFAKTAGAYRPHEYSDEDDFSAYSELLRQADIEDDSVPFDMYTVKPREGLDDTDVYSRAENYTSASREENDGVYSVQPADAARSEENASTDQSELPAEIADTYSDQSTELSETDAYVEEPSLPAEADLYADEQALPAETDSYTDQPALSAEADSHADQPALISEKDAYGGHSPVSFKAEVIASSEQDKPDKAGTSQPPKKVRKPYVIPPTSLLIRGTGTVRNSSEKEFGDTARILERTLAQFGVKVAVTNVSCGPTVTRYELKPELGVKVSQIVNLTDDIKLALAAADIRIEAPIPGKSAIGIEVPNKSNLTVHLRDLIESDTFRNAKAKLLFAVGMDIAGTTIVGDIDKMPHLLIAGATGSGKSVCINTMVLSLLYRYSPDEVKLIMVDPKVVELSVYNGIPHLLIPVVTDPKKAAAALNWAVEEMMKRYKMFEREGVRDISGYNQHIANFLKEGRRVDESTNLPYEKMPQIVIIIDELADLMMVSKNEVEDAICRIAQLARAAGIHLVIATQRPSVNVITGVIKANIPSRIAFAVSSGVDSRTILDSVGAEKLLGKGDMLYYPQGTAKPVRIQGAFVSDDEIKKVVDFIVQQDLADYDPDTIGRIEAGSSGSAGAAQDKNQKEQDERDALFAEAGRYIIEAGKASIGNLQRKFRIGFNRAARIMDQLCECGVVGREQGTKPREILMTIEEFEDYLTL